MPCIPRLKLRGRSGHPLQAAYKACQVIGSATVARLREAVEVVQSREPGTAPRSRAKNADMIDYIVEHVAAPGY